MSAERDLPGPELAPWVETREERCRAGRRLVTLVNHRDGRAAYLRPAELDPRSGAVHRAAMAELDAQGFTASSADIAPQRERGAGIVWRGADRQVRRWHAAGLHRAFDRPFVVAQLALAVVGTVAIVATLRTSGLELRAHPGQIPLIVVLGLVAVAIHELGHALVTVHHGRSVRTVGLRLHLGTPAFYVDSADALLLERRQRLVQAAAGPWAEWLVTSVLALTFLLFPHDAPCAAVLHRFVVVNVISIAINLLPFVGLDGSLLLADLVREPDLGIRTLDVLAGTDDEVSPALAGYAVANALVAAGLLVSAGFFWWELFGNSCIHLWRSGPIGEVLLIAAGVAIAMQVAPAVRDTLEPARVRVSSLRRRIAFRLERRWRVDAVLAFRSLPEVARLDEQQLGVLAGRLRLVDADDAVLHASSGVQYVRRSRVRRRPSFVALPDGWREAVRRIGPTVAA